MSCISAKTTGFYQKKRIKIKFTDLWILGRTIMLIKKLRLNNTLVIRFAFLLFVIATSNTSYAKTTAQEKSNSWNESEYGSDRSSKSLETAFTSKAFSWLSGSPADNEKLSVGKNAQFFGFVALRRDSGRAANRGALGKAFYSIATSEQRKIINDAAQEEAPLIIQWWAVRSKILRILETHLYDGLPIDDAYFEKLAREFGDINGQVVLIEAKAFAALEDSLDENQRALLAAWRAAPEKAFHHPNLAKYDVEINGLSNNEAEKKTADLFAKSFSWITGSLADTEVIPLGQPAQFFGFVSIRHKSGHGAKRGKISKEFRAILTKDQQKVLKAAVKESAQVDGAFFAIRHKILNELLLLRNDPASFDLQQYQALNKTIGEIEADAALVQAKAYRSVRASMNQEQVDKMMALRSNYIVDPNQIETGSIIERGEKLAILCSGCHELKSGSASNKIAPTLNRVFNRNIAEVKSFEYSNALLSLNDQGLKWNEDNLDKYLKAPKAYAPGTRMEFQGLIRDEDRKALIEYLKRL